MLRTERYAERLPHVAAIILDRPDKRNALTEDMLRGLREAVREFGEEDDVRAIVLRGEGRVFCAGFDLPACRDEPERLGAMLETLAAACAALRACRVPVVCAAHGAAVAGGCALAASCDLVITDRAAKLGYPVVTIGVSPAVSAPALGAQVGRGRARERLLDPSLVTGERAREIGLATLAVDLPDDVTPRAQIEAKKLAEKPPFALQRTKAWINGLTHDDAHAQRALRASLAGVGGDEQRELLASVLDARRGGAGRGE